MGKIMFFIFLLNGLSVLAAEVSLSTYEEISNIVKNKNFIGGKDETSLRLLNQVVEPTRKIQGTIEENETTMSNE